MAQNRNWVTIVFGLIVATIVFLFFSGGILGVTNDSIMYFQSADFISKGNGYLTQHYGEIKPATHFPPLYSMALAFTAKMFNLSVGNAAWFINLISWVGCCVMLMIYLDGFGIHPFFAFACLLQQGVVHVFMMAWSEPLFMVLSIVGLYFIFPKNITHDLRKTAFAAIVLGLSAIVRYNGLVWLPLAVMIVVFSDLSLQKKLLHSVTFIFIFLSPFLLWLSRNKLLTGVFFGRESKVNNHLLPEGFLRSGVECIGGWYYPGWFGLGFVAGLMAITALMIYAFILLKRYRTTNVWPPALIWLIIMFMHVVLIAFTAMFIDKTAIPDQRIFNFVSLGFVILLVFAFHDLQMISIKLKWIFVGFIVLLFSSEYLQSFRTLNEHRKFSSDFTSTSLPSQKPVIAVIRSLKDTLPILACNFDDVYFNYLTGKKVRYLNDLYTMPVGQQLYMAFYKEQHVLPETGYQYLNIDSVVPGYLYKMEIK